jgi:hypothetical protein
MRKWKQSNVKKKSLNKYIQAFFTAGVFFVTNALERSVTLRLGTTGGDGQSCTLDQKSFRSTAQSSQQYAPKRKSL